MATETDIDKRLCLCGQGEIEIHTSTPDHPWVRSYAPTYSGHINCSACRATYTISDAAIVLQSEVAATEIARSAWWVAHESLNKSHMAQEIRNALAQTLDGFKTKKAIHEFVTKHGISTGGYGNFIRKYAGGQHFANGLMLSYLIAAQEALSLDSTEFKAKYLEVESLRLSIPTPNKIKTLTELI